MSSSAVNNFRKKKHSLNIYIKSSLDEDLPAPRKVDYVLSELLETEKIYIREIEEILQGYGEIIDSESFDCPEILRGKR